MSILNDIDSFSDVAKPELIWKNRQEFDKLVDEKIGRNIYETTAKIILPQFNELFNTSKCVQVSSNSSIVQDSSKQRLFDKDDENLFNASNALYHEKQDGNLCAKHAINNAVQFDLVTPGYLSVCADELKKK